MNIYERAVELADMLVAAGVNATADPRSATPPCVLVTPASELTNDLSCGFTARWHVVAMVPGPGNLDALKALSGLVDEVRAVLPWERATFLQYLLSSDNPPFMAYRFEFEEAI